MRPDQTHITVQVRSRDFPSTNACLHVIVERSDTAEPVESSEEMLDVERYPRGYPYHLLVSGGLSAWSRDNHLTPVARYRQIYERHMQELWQAEQKARKKANRNSAKEITGAFEGEESDGGFGGGSSE